MLQGPLGVVQNAANSSLLLLSQHRPELVEGLLVAVHQAFEPTLGPYVFGAPAILIVVLLRVVDDPGNLLVAESAGRRDEDLLLALGRHVAGMDADDAVGVDVEGDLDLRGALRRGG